MLVTLVPSYVSLFTQFSFICATQMLQLCYVVIVADAALALFELPIHIFSSLHRNTPHIPRTKQTHDRMETYQMSVFRSCDRLTIIRNFNFSGWNAAWTFKYFTRFEKKHINESHFLKVYLPINNRSVRMPLHWALWLVFWLIDLNCVRFSVCTIFQHLNLLDKTKRERFQAKCQS